MSDHKFLTIEQVSNVLNISQQTAFRLAATGKLPSLRIGRSVRVEEADLEEFIRNNKMKKSELDATKI